MSQLLGCGLLDEAYLVSDPLCRDGPDLVYCNFGHFTGNHSLDPAWPGWMNPGGNRADDDGVQVVVHKLIADDNRRPGFDHFTSGAWIEAYPVYTVSINHRFHPDRLRAILPIPIFPPVQLPFAGMPLPMGGYTPVA